ncbi:MAG: hypothetical protein RIQ81_1441 [Pseudomonadota bacterium]
MQKFRNRPICGLAITGLVSAPLLAASFTAFILVNCSIQERQIMDTARSRKSGGGNDNAERNGSSNQSGNTNSSGDSEFEGDPDVNELDENGRQVSDDGIIASIKGPVFLNSASPILTSSLPAQPGESQDFTLLDFEDAELRDDGWLAKQPAGITQTVVSGKGDSGVDKLSLAPRQGRNGGTALAVEYTTKIVKTPTGPKTEGSGLPGFWVTRKRPGLLAYGKDGYLLPEGRRANQIEFWVKFPKGFRKANASAKPMYYPNHVNFIFGTYHFDPAMIGKGSPVKESDNWHFYHQIFLRHDKAEDDWIRVLLNDTPQHQRGHSNRVPAVNPTANAGNYFEIMTRFYIDCHRYFADPEIQAEQVKMLVDDIKFRYVPPQQNVSIAFHEIENAALKTIKANVEHLIHFTVRNHGDKVFSGRLGKSTMGSVGVRITNLDGQDVRDIEIPAGSFATYIMRVATKAVTNSMRAGVSLVSRDQFLSDADSNTRSLSSNFVEKRWNNESGPHDAEVKGIFLRLKSTN